MNSTIKKLEDEAQRYMKKRLPIERDLMDRIYDLINQSKENIRNLLKSIRYVNISSLNNIVEYQVKPIITQYELMQEQVIEDSIRNSFEAGENQASNFLILTKENTETIEKNEDKKEELILALILFAKSVIRGLNDDILSSIDKNLYNAYILSKYEENQDFFGAELKTRALENVVNDSYKNIDKRVKNITQTEINRALNTGVFLTYIFAKRNIDNLYVKWVEVKDNKLCKYCRERANGGPQGEGIYEINSIDPPPLHPNCRCILIPVIM